MHLARPQRPAPGSYASRRRGTGRSPHAGLVLPGPKSSSSNVYSNLEPGETLFAFLDDVYVVLPPHRVRPVYDLLQHHLFNQARIQLNAGKTRVWNQAGQPPPNIQALGPDVWVGSGDTSSHEQGLMVLGTPVGTASYKLQQLQRTREQHNSFLQRLSELEDLQAAWLLLLFCASPRCHYHPDAPPTSQQHFPPNTTQQSQPFFGRSPNASHLTGTGPRPAQSGGLGLASATVLAPSAYWASWADAILVLQQQAPEAFAQLLHQLQADDPRSPAVEAAQHAATLLQDYGWQPPEWQHLADGLAPPRHHNSLEDGSSNNRPHSIQSRSLPTARPREPSPARVTIRATRQPSIHYNPLSQ